MNKIMTVLGVAAVATLAGCKDPTYKRIPLNDEPKNAAPVEVEPAPQQQAEAVPEKPAIEIKKGCLCPPGTQHKDKCPCGADDCKCVIISEVPVVPVTGKKPTPPAPAPAPEYTEYVVQHGDYLAKISKKFNVSIAAIKKANALTNDIVRVGQKLKVPGRHTIAATPAPVSTPKKPSTKVAPYTGGTKEYVVKNGDTIGAIAYANGLSIRQLKELNGLSKDTIRVGQKLKIPAEKVVSTKPASKQADTKKPLVKDEKKPATAPTTKEADASQEKSQDNEGAPSADEAAKIDAPVVESPATNATAAKADYEMYTVSEADDITSVAIRFGVTAARIRELNGMADDAQINEGQVIKVPASPAQP